MKKRNRKLALHAETLHRLSGDALSGVQGATAVQVGGVRPISDPKVSCLCMTTPETECLCAGNETVVGIG